MLAFFVHNAIHPIMRHSNPKTRLCDLGIAYSMVGTLYVIVGFAGALVLPKFAPMCFPEIRSSNCQSFISMFNPNEIFAFMANCALFMQLFTVSFFFFFFFKIYISSKKMFFFFLDCSFLKIIYFFILNEMLHGITVLRQV